MRVAVAGGKLQGIEASYLALKAGWDVLLLDKDPIVPAAGLCHEFHQIDILQESFRLSNILKGVDFVIPAFEQHAALASLEKAARKASVPLAFDSDAFALTSSKIKSNILFDELGIPAPSPAPIDKLPVIVKPSGQSGSSGIQKLNTKEELLFFSSETEDSPHEWIIEEWLDGPSYSLEILGCQGDFVPLQTTLIEVDGRYDCKRVVAPVDLAERHKNELRKIARKIAASLDLTGVMDVEVVLHDEKLKVLEIDARLPSQTPTAVYHSTHINILEHLYDIFSKKELDSGLTVKEDRFVIFEHIKVAPERVEIMGEHILAKAGPLKLMENFFGADEALTDFDSDESNWVATLIIHGEKKEDVWNRHLKIIESIRATLATSKGKVQGVNQ